jgi:8-oxo-dGTP pyrophosphatase MutT (NUDIX family)
MEKRMTEHRAWETLSYEQILDTPYLKIRRERALVPDGPIIPDYYIIENRGWVGIVPVLEDGRFLLNKQYKHGIGLVVIEFPAGGLEPEEEPLMAARRELMEETGYSFEDDQVALLAQMLENPTKARTRSWWFLARGVRKTAEQKVDPVEVIENLLVTPGELLDLIHRGEFAVQGQIAAAYMALERLGQLAMVF